MRHIRFIPDNGSLVEVTIRTFQSRFLLRPNPTLNQIIAGVLGRAQRRLGVLCHGVIFLSNHAHLLLTVDNADQLANFMEYINSNIAREVARLLDWPDRIWARRYQAPERGATRTCLCLASGPESCSPTRLAPLMLLSAFDMS